MKDDTPASEVRRIELGAGVVVYQADRDEQDRLEAYTL